MRSRTPFAWRNLTHRKVRALVALSGVTFSVLLIFMELGFHAAILSSATAVYDATDADIFLISPQYQYLGQTGTIPRTRLFQAKSVSGVTDAVAFYADTQQWRNPVSRLRYQILLLGFDPSKNPLQLPAESMKLLTDGRILIDSLSRPHFGPQDPGTTTEIGGYRIQISGQYRIGPGFATDGAAVTSEDTFLSLHKSGSPEQVSLGLVHVRPAAGVAAAAAALRTIIPTDTRVLTRAEMMAQEDDFWARETSIGPVFALGAGLGLVVGVVILYQVMATDIANRMREYATLLALGYDHATLKWIVFEEVSIFAVVGFGFGWILSVALYKAVRDNTGLPMTMPVSRAALILILTVFMCWSAGLLAMRKLRQADPAVLY
ncbi:MAG TPA: ABC transporter permease DevC [Terriglobia bacterium]|jgi:putative ABC transport system permease protein